MTAGMKTQPTCGLTIVAIVACVAAHVAFAGDDPRGTIDAPIIDSQMTEKAAFDGLDPNCPKEIRIRQRIVNVTYYGFDAKIHKGQLIVDEDLVQDVREVFALMLDSKFPIGSVIPLADPRFRKDGRWSDVLSMAANNTSAFNYRLITGRSTELSMHAYGRAMDINPMQNPYQSGGLVLPRGAKYEPNVAGTLTADHPLVKAFLSRGWKWGGSWNSPKDYQHFEKPVAKALPTAPSTSRATTPSR